VVYFSFSPQKKVLLDDVLTKIQNGVHPVEFLRFATAPSHSDLDALSIVGILLLIDLRFISTVTRTARNRLTSMSMRSKSGINMSQSVASILKSNPEDI